MAEESSVVERRHDSADYEHSWESLNMMQKVAMSELNHYGYQLVFTRKTNEGVLAVALCDQKVATISNDGEIDMHPGIKTRI
ncbi:hypothetical protein [Algicola sagamiensis]|uniref:hypothetical protein n=1 Tax=Algicola sagamiensis TaxID=163869 RepID=UPI000364A112|nr:hypothetical protein [Algicola sagamiensis]